MKKLLLLFLISIFIVTSLFSLKLYLKKGIIIPNAKIINDMKIFPIDETEIEVEAMFGKSQGRTKLKKSDIHSITTEDEDLIPPVILEKKGTVKIKELFNFPSSKKDTIIHPYSSLTTLNNSFVTIGINENPIFKIYPNSKLFFDISVTGLPQKYSIRESSSIESEEIALKEKYLINLISGILVGVDVDKTFNKEYLIYCPNNILLKINSPIFYIEYTKKNFIIAVLSGYIVFDEQNNSQTATINPEQIAVIDYKKDEYIIIKHVSTNKKIFELLNKIKSEEPSFSKKSENQDMEPVSPKKEEIPKVKKVKKVPVEEEDDEEEEDEDE